MFGLSALFTALARLTCSVNRSADLFDAANANLARQLGIEAETPALEHKDAEDAKPARNGRAKATA